MHTAGNMQQILFLYQFCMKFVANKTPQMQVWPERHWEPTATRAKQPNTANNEHFIIVSQDPGSTFLTWICLFSTSICAAFILISGTYIIHDI